MSLTFIAEKMSEMHTTSPRDKPLLNETLTGDSVLSGKHASPLMNKDKKISLDEFKIEKVDYCGQSLGRGKR